MAGRRVKQTITYCAASSQLRRHMQLSNITDGWQACQVDGCVVQQQSAMLHNAASSAGESVNSRRIRSGFICICREQPDGSLWGTVRCVCFRGDVGTEGLQSVEAANGALPDGSQIASSGAHLVPVADGARTLLVGTIFRRAGNLEGDPQDMLSRRGLAHSHETPYWCMHAIDTA